MRKILVTICAITAVATLIYALQLRNKSAIANNVLNFSINDYYEEIEDLKDLPYFINNINVGNILSENDAIDKAEKLWEYQFENRTGFSLQDYTIDVYYDSNSKCWLIDCELPEPYLHEDYTVYSIGVAPIAIIKENGEVLGSWLR